MGRRAPETPVVDAYAGRVSVAIDIAVEDNNGNPFFIHFLNYRRERFGLVRRHYDYVEAIVDEISYVSDLFGVAVVGRTYFGDGIFVEHYLAVYFIVHLRSPVVLATLRDADSIGFAFRATPKNENYSQYETV